ncbi:MAG: CZB domain-containing protein [Methylobacter sp.]
MDIELILSKHFAWKTKLIHALYSGEPMDPTDIGKDNCCDAGKWMHKEGKFKYGHLPSYKTCLNRHAEFHIEAAKIVSAINAKQFAEVKNLLNFDSSFSLVALELWAALKQLEQEIRDALPDDLCSEFECLTNLIQEIDRSQDFKNPQELINHVFYQDKDSE